MSNNWAILSITHDDSSNQVIIVITTNAPCHLTCYISDIAPLRHPAYRTLRGLNVKWGAYFCFVAWKIIIQSEPIDSLTHTFVIPDWFFCQWRYFTFKGTVAGIDSPSIGPIFAHHNSYLPPEIIIRRPNAPGDRCHWRLDGAGDICPDHFKNVDDIIPDYDTTYLSGIQTINQWYYYDLYNIPPSPGIGTILHIALNGIFTSVGPFAFPTVARFIIKTYGTEYHGPVYDCSNVVWESKIWTLNTNPFTSLPWTEAEVSLLQIGVGLRKYLGVGWSVYGKCTQEYLTIATQS